MKQNKDISLEEKYNMLLTYAERKIGYKETHEFLDEVGKYYSPIEYAVQKTLQTLEKR